MMRKKLRNYLLLCILLSSCAYLETEINKAPIVERCILLSKTCFCYDARQPVGQREKEMPLSYCKGYHCVSNNDYNTLNDYYDTLKN